jgi:hypothetical protein
MGRIVAALVAVLVVCSCGGGSSKTAKASSTTTTTASSGTTTTVESAETSAWVAAAAAGVGGSDLKVSASDAECLGRALVETVTVGKLKAAGVTMAALRDPNTDLPPGLAASLSPATKLALGAALQACAGGVFGALLVQAFAQSNDPHYQLDAASRACVNRWFATPEGHALASAAALNVDPTKADASQIADVIVTCLDVATLLMPEFHVTFTSTERTCINQVARSGTALRDAFASSITNSGSNTAANRFGADIIKCLTPEHLAQIANASK